ncbi:hypothetical protein M514_04147 [Trichuris suis]|uniref:Uncharacterized protein n=1 Tax=Trichuris suis TaxID=68888 RepID=A0A085NG44_9BILA|nr:hypothetical protein M514_04147 [Trichuris suis]
MVAVNGYFNAGRQSVGYFASGKVDSLKSTNDVTVGRAMMMPPPRPCVHQTITRGRRRQSTKPPPLSYRVEESSGKWPLVSHSPVVVVSFSQRRKADIKKKWSTKLTSIETLQLQANNRKKGIAEHNYGRQSFPAKVSNVKSNVACPFYDYWLVIGKRTSGYEWGRNCIICPNLIGHMYGVGVRVDKMCQFVATDKALPKLAMRQQLARKHACSFLLTQLEVLLLSTVFIRGRETFCTCELSMICRLPKRNFNRRIPMQTKVILLRREKRALKSNPPL